MGPDTQGWHGVGPLASFKSSARGLLHSPHDAKCQKQTKITVIYYSARQPDCKRRTDTDGRLKPRSAMDLAVCVRALPNPNRGLVCGVLKLHMPSVALWIDSNHTGFTRITLERNRFGENLPRSRWTDRSYEQPRM